MVLFQVEHAPGIIREAAVSTLGILALMVLVIATLALLFFRGAGERVKIGIFTALLAGASAFGYAVVDEAGSEPGAAEAFIGESAGVGGEPEDGGEPLPVRRGKPVRTVESNGYVVALEGCKGSGREVTCSFLITNRAPDRQLWLNLSRTRFVDPEGNEYSSEKGTLGRQSGGGSIFNDLITDVPLRASVTFPAVPARLRKMAVLELHFGEFTLQMRDVPVA